MLALRPCCEHCGKALPYNATDAMICSFECTYCETCALTVFKNVCPSCGGNFEKRPIRPAKHLKKYPPLTQHIIKPKTLSKIAGFIEDYKNIPPADR
ncbi:MAG: DUF1272 domain-containing protein [Bacteroidota bacterium]